MKPLISRYKQELAGAVAGAIMGWLYWYYVGCASGTCPISSSPVVSTLYGGLLGILGIGVFKKENKQSKTK